MSVDVPQAQFKSVSFECGEEIENKKSSGGGFGLGGAAKFSESAETRRRVEKLGVPRVREHKDRNCDKEKIS